MKTLTYTPAHTSPAPSPLLSATIVTVSYLGDTLFLLCVLRCLFFPLALASYMEDRYTFTLGPRSFSLSPVPEGEPIPVPLLLFTS